MLCSPIEGEILYSYQAAVDFAVIASRVSENNEVESRYFNAEKIAYALVVASRKLRFGFDAMKNVAEYVALINGLELAYSMGIRNLGICSNSQLVVR